MDELSLREAELKRRESTLVGYESEVEGRVGRLKNKKPVGKDEVAGEMVNDGGDTVVDWI